VLLASQARSKPEASRLSEMKIAILSPAIVSWFGATLVERGHQITFGPFGRDVSTAVDSMIRDGIEGVLIVTVSDETLEEIAARFSRATGRPVWRNLTEIPRCA
jgi:hypothetical protein